MAIQGELEGGSDDEFRLGTACPTASRVPAFAGMTWLCKVLAFAGTTGSVAMVSNAQQVESVEDDFGPSWLNIMRNATVLPEDVIRKPRH